MDVDAFDHPGECLGAEPDEGEPINRPVHSFIAPTVLNDGGVGGPKFPSEVDVKIIVIGEDEDDRVQTI